MFQGNGPNLTTAQHSTEREDMNESLFTKQVCDELKRVNATVFNFVAGSPGQTPGIPDRYVSHMLFQGFLEFKGTKTSVSQVQTIMHRELNRHKRGQCLLVRLLDQANRELVIDIYELNQEFPDKRMTFVWKTYLKNSGIEFLKTCKGFQEC